LKVEDVNEALTELGIEGMTTIDVKRFRRQEGHIEIYRGSEYSIDFIPKVLISVIVADAIVESAVKAIVKLLKPATAWYLSQRSTKYCEFARRKKVRKQSSIGHPGLPRALRFGIPPSSAQREQNPRHPLQNRLSAKFLVAGAADPVDTTETLDDAHRVPVDVVVDEVESQSWRFCIR
jgi:hypothetical protein